MTDAAPSFDVFLSFNSADAPLVRVLADRLRREAGLRVFTDETSVLPGDRWFGKLEDAIQNSAAMAVLIGGSGEGPWQREEVEAAINRATRSQNEFRVI